MKRELMTPCGPPVHLRHLEPPPAQNPIKFVNPNVENYDRNIRHAASLGLPVYSQDMLLELDTRKPCRAIVCGSGPSLGTPEVLDRIRTLQLHQGWWVFACKAAIGFLADNGIDVNWGVSMDPGAHIAAPHKIKRVPGVRHLIASSSDPALFEYLKDEDVTIFHSATGYENEVHLYESLFDNPVCMGGGFNVVNRAVSAVMYMGAKEIVLAGTDCGWRAGADFYVDSSPSLDGVDMCDQGVVDGTPWMTRPDMLASAVSLARLANKMPAGTVEFIGDTLPGSLRSKDEAFLKSVADFS